MTLRIIGLDPGLNRTGWGVIDVSGTEYVRVESGVISVPKGDLSARLGVIVRELSAVIPVEYQSGFCHRMVMFGREYCIARSPRCGECPVSALCAKNGVKA